MFFVTRAKMTALRLVTSNHVSLIILKRTVCRGVVVNARRKTDEERVAICRCLAESGTVIQLEWIASVVRLRAASFQPSGAGHGGLKRKSLATCFSYMWSYGFRRFGGICSFHLQFTLWKKRPERLRGIYTRYKRRSKPNYL